MHCNSIFNPFLAAFRKGFGCHTNLLQLLGDWRQALVSHNYVAAILKDLSKAVDCLPHNLVTAKLQAHGLSPEAVQVIASYLSDRLQQVRPSPNTSSWPRLHVTIVIGGTINSNKQNQQLANCYKGRPSRINSRVTSF